MPVMKERINHPCQQCGAAQYYDEGETFYGRCLDCSRKCCPAARIVYCICQFATRCDEHGERHHGSHE